MFNLRNPFRRKPVIDSRTGRPVGDHGSGTDAIEFALERIEDHYDRQDFLTAWLHGDLFEYPDFYEWLRKEGR